MTVVMPGVPKRRLLISISRLPSGRISKDVTCRWGNCNRASIETEPGQKPISQNEVRRFSSKALKVSRRIGALVIIRARPSSSSNASSGMPKKRGESIPPFTDCSPSPVVKIRQLGYSNVSAAASSSVIRRISSFAGCPRCSPMYMV